MVFGTLNPEHRVVPEGSSGLGLEHPWQRGQRRRKSVHWSVPGWLLPAAAPSPVPARYMAGQPVPHGYGGVVDADLPRSLAPYLPSSPQNACFPLGLPCSTLTRVPQSLIPRDTSKARLLVYTNDEELPLTAPRGPLTPGPPLSREKGGEGGKTGQGLSQPALPRPAPLQAGIPALQPEAFSASGFYSSGFLRDKALAALTLPKQQL